MAAEPKPEAKLNVLFIAVDDLNHWVGYLGRNQQVKTPNLDRLARRGVRFTHSYCASPLCNPSRTALLSGLRPSTSGVYGNGHDWRQVIPESLTFNNHAVRTEKWRYIRYHDGGEELYDETKDPLEWTNLAAEPEYAEVKRDLAKWLPKVNAPPRAKTWPQREPVPPRWPEG